MLPKHVSLNPHYKEFQLFEEPTGWRKRLIRSLALGLYHAGIIYALWISGHWWNVALFG